MDEHNSNSNSNSNKNHNSMNSSSGTKQGPSRRVVRRVGCYPPDHPPPTSTSFSLTSPRFVPGGGRGVGVGPYSMDGERERDPVALVRAAYEADARWNLSSSAQLDFRCPSLSLLAAEVFDPVTGVPAHKARAWADAMVDIYTDAYTAALSWKEPSQSLRQSQSQLQSQQQPLQLQSQQRSPVCVSVSRPCGYMFRRGDIAWNCRTCQSDPTCVLCDTCFQASDHTGHEVFFHRTSPGGCCDCGDPEAWATEGCCPVHRPTLPSSLSSSYSSDTTHHDNNNNNSENKNSNEKNNNNKEWQPTAVSSSLQGRQWSEQIVEEESRPNPARTAALGVVIGAAVRCIVDAVEGATTGTDLGRWPARWAEQCYRLRTGRHYHEDNSIHHYSNNSHNNNNNTNDKRTPEERAEDLAWYRRMEHLEDGLSAMMTPTQGYNASSSPSFPNIHNINTEWPHYPKRRNMPQRPGTTTGTGTGTSMGSTKSLESQQQQQQQQQQTSEFPTNFHLHLRLHNDDVHTFEEVIDALVEPWHPSTDANDNNHNDEMTMDDDDHDGHHSNNGFEDFLEENSNVLMMIPHHDTTTATATSTAPSTATATASPTTHFGRVFMYHNNNNNNNNGSSSLHFGEPPSLPSPPPFQRPQDPPLGPQPPLVSEKQRAMDMTHRVDSDGQVLVKKYDTFQEAYLGYWRLRHAGLQCSVLSTAQLEAEKRAKVLTAWLADTNSSNSSNNNSSSNNAKCLASAKELLVHALLDVTNGQDPCGPVAVWPEPRTVPQWALPQQQQQTNKPIFPPHLPSSYLTREEAQVLYQAMYPSTLTASALKTSSSPTAATTTTTTNSTTTAMGRYRSPHGLWSTLEEPYVPSHPLLASSITNFSSSIQTKEEEENDTISNYQLVPLLWVVDTDLRPAHECDSRLTATLEPHRLPFLANKAQLMVTTTSKQPQVKGGSTTTTKSTLSSSSSSSSLSFFRAPASPLTYLLLMDPYPPKPLRGAIHRLLLSLLVHPRFRSRYAAVLGAVAYRPLSTLFCAGCGTEADTVLETTVQIFTAGSLVRALGDPEATRALLECDNPCYNLRRNNNKKNNQFFQVQTIPLAWTVARAVHANMLGATLEAKRNQAAEETHGSSTTSTTTNNNNNNFVVLPPSSSEYSTTTHHSKSDNNNGNNNMFMTPLPAAPDDSFLDSRAAKHRRLRPLLRDLEYLADTPGTAGCLLRQHFGPTWARLLRLVQGMDLQKRRVGGGHVEYERHRWIDAFQLNLVMNVDALSEPLLRQSPPSSIGPGGGQERGQLQLSQQQQQLQRSGIGHYKDPTNYALGCLFASLLREIKHWLYQEHVLKVTTNNNSNHNNTNTNNNSSSNNSGNTGNNSSSDLNKEESMWEVLQRSTLHVSPPPSWSFHSTASESTATATTPSTSTPITTTTVSTLESTTTMSLSTQKKKYEAVEKTCANGLKITEAQLRCIEAALVTSPHSVGDWLKVPHSPLMGHHLSFHLPLHRALASAVIHWCSSSSSPASASSKLLLGSSSTASTQKQQQWDLPVLDTERLDRLLAPTVTADNCQVVFGTNTTSNTASNTAMSTINTSNNNKSISSSVSTQTNYASLSSSVMPLLGTHDSSLLSTTSTTSSKTVSERSLAVGAVLASVKVVHSLCDHPLRCLAASQQIERHLWARNGNAAAGIADNYAHSVRGTFRDLDMVAVQLSAAGAGTIGLGPRRTFPLLVSRWGLDGGYLTDPVRHHGGNNHNPINNNQMNNPNNNIPNNSQRRSNATNRRSVWVAPPRLQDPEHAGNLAESLFATVCALVTELPSLPRHHNSNNNKNSNNDDDEDANDHRLRRELLHALAAEPRSYSGALAACSRGGPGIVAGFDERNSRTKVERLLRKLTVAKTSGSVTTYELAGNVAGEYDPTYYHLRRSEHQGAMDRVARLRRRFCSQATNNNSSNNNNNRMWLLPLVCPPSSNAHPRFVPCRLLLHLPAMDAALRRALLYTLTGGRWTPPEEPNTTTATATTPTGMAVAAKGTGTAVTGHTTPVATTGLHKRSLHRGGGTKQTPPSSSSTTSQPPSPPSFSPDTVASSAVSFLEVLQVLTLQAHTLEECARLGTSTLATMDPETRRLASKLSIRTYLERMVHVPPSLIGCWALQCPVPLPSAGSGAHRGSLLGLLVALYEHRGQDSAETTPGSTGGGGSGGARVLVSDGLKWLLRLVATLASSLDSHDNSNSNNSIISMEVASRRATEGIPPLSTTTTNKKDVASIIREMLNLPDLWPAVSTTLVPNRLRPSPDKEARRRAQQKALEQMRQRQASFAASLGKSSGHSLNDTTTNHHHKGCFDDFDNTDNFDSEEDEDDLCIICKCADDDRSSGPLGYLGYVQRSRVLSLRERTELSSLCGHQPPLLPPTTTCTATPSTSLSSLSPSSFSQTKPSLFSMARVVGDKGCQLRAKEEMNSVPVACLPRGSIVTILHYSSGVTTLSLNNNQEINGQGPPLHSRRVYVRCVQSQTIGTSNSSTRTNIIFHNTYNNTNTNNNNTNTNNSNNSTVVVEGWASLESSQGYVILRPLVDTATHQGRWGTTRPVLQLCGHAAHLQCVETHCLSLHQRSAADQPFDGRFAANVEEGEFLCPLCKQLSNVVVPKPKSSRPLININQAENDDDEETVMVKDLPMVLSESTVTTVKTRGSSSSSSMIDSKERDAIRRFGDNLTVAMEPKWNRHLRPMSSTTSTTTTTNVEPPPPHPTQPQLQLLQQALQPQPPQPNPLPAQQLQQLLHRRDILQQPQQPPAQQPRPQQNTFHLTEQASSYNHNNNNSTNTTSSTNNDTVTIKKKPWHEALSKWDYEDAPYLRLLRQQLVAFSAVGYYVASAEASARVGTSIEDPWASSGSEQQQQPRRRELLRIMDATAALLATMSLEESSWPWDETATNNNNDDHDNSFPSDHKGRRRRRNCRRHHPDVGALLGRRLIGDDGILALELLQRPLDYTSTATATSVSTSPVNSTHWSSSYEGRRLAYLASQPCHVARDGMLVAKSQARATAAGMWATDATAPVPLAVNALTCPTTNDNHNKQHYWNNVNTVIKSLAEEGHDHSNNNNNNGTSNVDDNDEHQQTNSNNERLTVASAFLHLPLLAWDLHTMAGGVFSTLLLRQDGRSSSTAGRDFAELLTVAKTLLVGRLLQVLVSPHGFVVENHFNNNNNDSMMEGTSSCTDYILNAAECYALEQLGIHCSHMIDPTITATNVNTHGKKKTEQPQTSSFPMVPIAHAILPFGRSLILLLRVCYDVVRRRIHQRTKFMSRHASSSSSRRSVQGRSNHTIQPSQQQPQVQPQPQQHPPKPSPSEKLLTNLIRDPKAMTTQDGFYILSMLNGPMPSELFQPQNTTRQTASNYGPSHSRGTIHKHNEWPNIVDRWLASVVALEAFHGSRGKGMVYSDTMRKWVPSYCLKEGKNNNEMDQYDHPNDYNPNSSFTANNNSNNNNNNATITHLDGHGQWRRQPSSDLTRGSSDDTSKTAAMKTMTTTTTNDNNGTSMSMVANYGFTHDDVDMGSEESFRHLLRRHNELSGGGGAGSSAVTSGGEIMDTDDFTENEEMEDVDDDDIDVDDEDVALAIHHQHHHHLHHNDGIDYDIDDEDVDVDIDDEEEEEESMNEDDEDDDSVNEEELVLFLERNNTHGGGPDMVGLSEEDESSVHSALEEADERQQEFAYVSCSPIIPYQPSFLGKQLIGPGPKKVAFDFTVANEVLCDLSHCGMRHSPGAPTSGLIRLPTSFIELYNIVNKVKRRDLATLDDTDDTGSAETAICLLTGAIMRSGSTRRTMSRSPRPAGPCTLHARKIGSGVGIFFLVQKCTVLLMHNNKSAYSASLYVDDHGEEDPGLRRGRPLYFKPGRYEALETLWRQHGIPREVAQIRSTSDRVIRDNWY